MSDFDPTKLETLSAQFEGLEAAAEGLAADPGVAVSIRRIARSLQGGAEAIGAGEIAAGAQAIQRASDAQLERSVANFLARVEELRSEVWTDELHILVVEDNKTVATATVAYLKAPGRTVHVAENAAQAERLLADEPIDAVVLDLILPDRDGRDLLVQMREDERTSVIPVLVLSAQGGAVARAECMAVGADDFLEKPAEPKELRAAVLKLLRGGRRSDPVRDGLTGLPNRVGMVEQFEARLGRATQSGGALTVAVITLDPLDHVLSTLGRDAADRFLLEVASALHASLGGGDALGRWERSELVALFSDLTPSEAKPRIEEAIQTVSSLDTLDFVRGAGIDVTFSGGLALAEPGQPLKDVISIAERFLYGEGEPAVTAEDEPTDMGLKRVFVVEDDRTTSTLLHHRLVRDGYEVFDFLNGEEAFAWAQTADFDIAILDVKVPGMDGFELVERLRSIERFQTLPIIMLTGMGSEADVIRGLELGANDYMLKPFSPSELLARVRRLLLAEKTGAAADPPTVPSPSLDTDPV